MIDYTPRGASIARVLFDITPADRIQKTPPGRALTDNEADAIARGLVRDHAVATARIAAAAQA